MKRTLLAACFAATLFGCGGDTNSNGAGFYTNDVANEQQRQQLVADATKVLANGAAPRVTEGVNNLGFKLLSKTIAASKETNVCISPASVDLALAMVYNGAAGSSQKQLGDALGVGKIRVEDVNDANKNLRMVLTNADPKVKLLIANSIWAQNGVTLKPEFLQKNTNYFNANVSTTDFTTKEGVKAVNDWISQQTGGNIPKMLDKPRNDISMIALNAVYFKGLWKDPFKPENTRPQDFKLANSKTVSVPMMNRKGDYVYAKIDKGQIISMPYGSARLAMTIMLPTSTSDLPALVKNLDYKTWSKWLASASSSDVNVTIPKWKASFDTNLKQPLKDVGVSDPFDPKKADFSGIKEGGGLFISDVLHKTFIDVNEEGTEAAAATGVVISPTLARVPTTFVADHPFLYAIRDTTTGAILFTGVLYDPSA